MDHFDTLDLDMGMMDATTGVLGDMTEPALGNLAGDRFGLARRQR